MLEKTGEVKTGNTTCDHCSNAAVAIIGNIALCRDCLSARTTKQASMDQPLVLRSFTEPIPTDDSI